MTGNEDDIPVVKAPLLQRRPLLRWLLPVLLIVFIAHSAWVWNQGGGLARWIKQQVTTPPPPVSNYVNLDATIITGQDGAIRFITSGLEFTNAHVREAIRSMGEGDRAYTLAFFPAKRRRGVWAITERFDIGSIRIDPPEGDQQSLRRAFVEHLQERGIDLMGLDLVPTGRAMRRTILWTGYVHDGITLVLLAAIALAGRMNWITRRWKRRLAAGLCPHCKYPLPERPQPRCPECGWRCEGGVV